MSGNEIGPRFKKISYKLYLSIQMIIFGIGVLIALRNILALVHDVPFSYMARSCIENALGQKIITRQYLQSKNLGRWDLGVATYAESLGHPAEKYSLKEALERQCSDYVNISIRRDDNSIEVNVKNYLGNAPASLLDRAKDVGLSIILPFCLMAAAFGLMRWISWLLKD